MAQATAPCGIAFSEARRNANRSDIILLWQLTQPVVKKSRRRRSHFAGTWTVDILIDGEMSGDRGADDPEAG